MPVDQHSSILRETREREGRLVKQRDIPREFSKLDTPQE